jgi:hypothetical protein
MISRWAIIAGGVVFGVMGCTVTNRTPVNGVVGGHSIFSLLDHAVAEETLIALTESRPPEHPAVAGALSVDELPKFEELKKLSGETSPDTATLVLIDRIGRMEAHRDTQVLYDAYLQRLRQWGRGGFHVIAACLNGTDLPELHFVPGWFYERSPWTGADFAAQRRLFVELGLTTALIAVNENDAVEANAQIVAQHIRNVSEHRRIILVSTSKGGPETAHALGTLFRDADTQNILAWVNIGGVLLGSPLADMAVTFPSSLVAKLLFWRDQVDASHSVPSLTSEKSAARFAQQRLPPNISVFNFVGVPLSGQVSASAREGYALLRRFGPNDGLTPLTHQWAHGGRIVLGVGLDHFFQDAEVDLKTAAMAFVVFESIGIARGRECVRPSAALEL